jgi:hypothetical protein
LLGYGENLVVAAESVEQDGGDALGVLVASISCPVTPAQRLANASSAQ